VLGDKFTTMKKTIIFGMATALLAVSSCSTVPLTGRSRLSLVDDSQLQQQAAIGYSQLLSDPSTKVVASSNANAAMVKRVGQKNSFGCYSIYEPKWLRRSN